VNQVAPFLRCGYGVLESFDQCESHAVVAFSYSEMNFEAAQNYHSNSGQEENFGNIFAGSGRRRESR